MQVDSEEHVVLLCLFCLFCLLILRVTRAKGASGLAEGTRDIIIRCPVLTIDYLKY